MSVILDFAYFMTIFGLFLLTLFILRTLLLPVTATLQSLLALITTVPATGDMSISVQTALAEQADTILWFYIKLAALLICGTLLFLGVTSLYKAFIWMHLKKLPLTKKYLFAFISKNMTWQGLWLIVALFIFFFFSVNFAAAFLILELFAYLYFTPFFRAVLSEKHTMKESYKETFVLGFKKFRHFIVPMIMIVITFMFGLWLFVILVNLILPAAILIVVFVFVFVAVSWARFYFYTIAQKIHSQLA